MDLAYFFSVMNIADKLFCNIRHCNFLAVFLFHLILVSYFILQFDLDLFFDYLVFLQQFQIFFDLLDRLFHRWAGGDVV